MHIRLLIVQTLGSRSRLGQQNSIKFILAALTIESENPVKMNNRKICDFTNQMEGTIDFISTDGNIASTMYSSAPHSMDSSAPLNATPGTGTARSALSVYVANLPDEQVANAAPEIWQHQQVNDQAEDDNQQKSSAVSEQAAVPSAADGDKGQAQEQPIKKGCDKCGKKFGLTGGFPCRCGGTYCAFHRYSDRHDCTFDYREMGAAEIRRDNPVVVPEKLRKL